jgi:hypothetical protein
MFRNRFTGEVKSADATPLLVNGAEARTAEASGGGINRTPLAPMRKEDAPNAELRKLGVSGAPPPHFEASRLAA